MKKHIGNILFYGIFALIIGISGFYMIQSKLHPEEPQSLFGITPMRVTSGSMEPKFPIGTIVFAKQQQNYRIGDIISFHSTLPGFETIITHRIKDVQGMNTIFTKGDNNQIVDQEPTNPQKIIGKVVFFIPLTTMQLITVISLLLLAGFAIAYSVGRLGSLKAKESHV